MIIRTATPADGAAIAAIYAPIVAQTVISFETDPPDASQMASRIASCLEHYPWLVMEEDGGVAGYAYAGQHRARAAYQWSCDITVYVAPTHHRRGVGKALYERLFDVLRMQGFAGAFAGIALPNASSIGLHEAMGFTNIARYPRVGFKLGAWRDVGWWYLELQRLGESPADPTPFSALVQAA